MWSQELAYRFPPAPTAERRRISVVRRTDSLGTRGAAITSLFDRCSLTVSTCPPTPIEKFRHAAAPIAPRRTPPQETRLRCNPSVLPQPKWRKGEMRRTSYQKGSLKLADRK